MLATIDWKTTAKSNILKAFLSLNIRVDENEFSQQLYTFFLGRLGLTVTLTDAALYLSVDKYYLCRLCRKNTGYSFHYMAMIVKMESAKALLRTTNLRVNNISDILAFSSVHYFNKVFKSYAGTSAGKYRRAV